MEKIDPKESGHIGPFGRLAYVRINKVWLPYCRINGQWVHLPRSLLPGEERFFRLMLELEGKTKEQLMRQVVAISADYEGMCGREDDSDAFSRFVSEVVLKLWLEE